MDVTYFRGDEAPYGNTYKLSPATLDDKPSVQACFNVTGDKKDPVAPQSLLPDLTNFQVIKSYFSFGQSLWKFCKFHQNEFWLGEMVYYVQ